MDWYLIHTKPRQEKCALQNLEQQGYECFLPMLSVEKIRQNQLAIIEEPLFPRYLFIRLGKGDTAKSWSPIRFTKGVNRLVGFGTEPAKVNDELVQTLKNHTIQIRSTPQSLFRTGDKVSITHGPFAGIEAIYQMADGEQRAMILIELMSKPVRMTVRPAQLHKLG